MTDEKPLKDTQNFIRIVCQNWCILMCSESAKMRWFKKSLFSLPPHSPTIFDKVYHSFAEYKNKGFLLFSRIFYFYLRTCYSNYLVKHPCLNKPSYFYGQDKLLLLLDIFWGAFCESLSLFFKKRLFIHEITLVHRNILLL